MTGCPNLSFSCSNISCSIWFCCGGGRSNKEHEREQNKQHQAPTVPNNNPQPSPPQPQEIAVPDHLRKPTPTYVEQPAAASPPPVPPPVAAPPPPAPPPPRRMPPTETYYTQPTTAQQQARPPPTLQTPTLPAPPKVHDPWTQTTQVLPQTHPVWSQTPTALMLPPSLPSPPNKVLHDMQRPNMQMIPASHVQSEMVHKPPPPQPPRPARQPSKTYHQTMPPTTVNQHHPAHSHLPSETCYYDEAALPDVVPPQALPLGNSQRFMGMGYYPQGHWE